MAQGSEYIEKLLGSNGPVGLPMQSRRIRLGEMLANSRAREETEILKIVDA